MWFASIIIAITFAAETGSIGRCARDDGSVLFTNLGCPTETRPLQSLEHAPHSYVDMQLPEIRHAKRPRSAKAKKRRPSEMTNRRSECEAARSALAQLRAQRRKGYRLEDAPQLEARESELKRTRQQTCS